MLIIRKRVILHIVESIFFTKAGTIQLLAIAKIVCNDTCDGASIRQSSLLLPKNNTILSMTYPRFEPRSPAWQAWHALSTMITRRHKKEYKNMLFLRTVRYYSSTLNCYCH